MKVIYQDQQELSNPLNGSELSDPGMVPILSSKLRGREPFLFELIGENGYKLLVGFSEECGCVQYSQADGTPPYLMAISDDETEGSVEFLAGGTPTPIPLRFCLPISVVESLIAEFIRDGRKSETVCWEEI